MRFVQEGTRRLWAEQDRHPGDRWRLFRTVGDFLGDRRVLYPGSYVDIAPSFVFGSVTYVDSDRRTPAFFGDEEGILEIIASHRGAPAGPVVEFIHGDYTGPLGLRTESFDLLVSLYAGFVSEYCTDYLKVGGFLLVNSSHGDAAMASIDDRYVLTAVVQARSGGYRVRTDQLETYLVQKSPKPVTPEHLHRTGRGPGYTKPAFAYLFERTNGAG